MKRINIHLDPSILPRQPRIAKITKSLADHGVFDRIYFIGADEQGKPRYEDLDEKRTIIRIWKPAPGPTRPNLIKGLSLVAWCLRALFFVFPMRVHCINCHRLPLLPFCALLKGMKGCSLIYDTHELETETATSRGWRRILAKLTERAFIRYADVIIVVSESIADWYMREYGLNNVWTVRNIPEVDTHTAVRRSPLLRDAFGIKQDHILFLYQGLLAEDRGIRMLLDVFSALDSSRHIVFMGFGPLTSLVKEYEDRFANIHYHPSVSQSELPYYTSGADVGLNLIENTCLNHYLCLPNKIWEYLNAGIPILVSDFPGLAKVVNELKCGWTCPVETEQLRKLIEGLSGEDINEKSKNILKLRDCFGWHVEEQLMLNAYQRISRTNTDAETQKYDQASSDACAKMSHTVAANKAGFFYPCMLIWRRWNLTTYKFYRKIS